MWGDRPQKQVERRKIADGVKQCCTAALLLPGIDCFDLLYYIKRGIIDPATTRLVFAEFDRLIAEKIEYTLRNTGFVNVYPIKCNLFDTHPANYGVEVFDLVSVDLMGSFSEPMMTWLTNLVPYINDDTLIHIEVNADSNVRGLNVKEFATRVDALFNDGKRGDFGRQLRRDIETWAMVSDHALVGRSIVDLTVREYSDVSANMISYIFRTRDTESMSTVSIVHKAINKAVINGLPKSSAGTFKANASRTKSKETHTRIIDSLVSRGYLTVGSAAASKANITRT